jgi:hypothetical protein
VLSFADYARLYGGLDARSLLGYAVSQFFANGGNQAHIIRLVSSDAAAATTTINGTAGNLVITAANGGQRGNNYGILIKNQSGGGNRFRIQVVYAPQGGPSSVVESFENVSLTSPDPSGRYVVDILAAQPNFIVGSTTGTPSAVPDIATAQMLMNGADGTVLTPATPAAAFETALLPTSGIGGVHVLEHVDLFNLLCVPGEIDEATISSLETFCRGHRAFLIADCSPDATVGSLQKAGGPNSTITGADGINAAFYFPWINAPDPLNQGGSGPFSHADLLREFMPRPTAAAACGKRQPAPRRVYRA